MGLRIVVGKPCCRWPRPSAFVNLSKRRRRPELLIGLLSSSVAEQYVEDVIALLAAGLGRRRRGEGRVLSRRDAIAVDHPGTRLNAAGNQVLRLSGRGGAAIDDVAAKRSLGSWGSQDPVPGRWWWGSASWPAPFASAVADATDNGPNALKCFGEAFHTRARFLRVLGHGNRSCSFQRPSFCVSVGEGAAASKTIPEGSQPTKARPGRVNSPPQHASVPCRLLLRRWTFDLSAARMGTGGSDEHDSRPGIGRTSPNCGPRWHSAIASMASGSNSKQRQSTCWGRWPTRRMIHSWFLNWLRGGQRSATARLSSFPWCWRRPRRPPPALPPGLRSDLMRHC